MSMKKTVLFSAFMATLFLMVSCGDPKPNGGGSENKSSYVLSKIKEFDNGVAQDLIEIKYASTNPLVVSELAVIHWGDESMLGAKRKMTSTKADVIDSKTLFKNIVRMDNLMTFDVEWLESTGDTEPYGSYEVTLNEKGAATSMKFTAKLMEMEDDMTTIEYNADGYITKYSRVSKRETQIFEFVYSGANISKLIYSYKGGDEANTFEEKYEVLYSDYTTDNKGGIMHPAMLDSDGMFEVFTSLGIFGKPPVSLPSKGDWGDNDVETYTYEKDANGCISTLTQAYTYMDNGTQKTDTDKYAYEYIEVKATK